MSALVFISNHSRWSITKKKGFHNCCVKAEKDLIIIMSTSFLWLYMKTPNGSVLIKLNQVIEFKTSPKNISLRLKFFTKFKWNWRFRKRFLNVWVPITLPPDLPHSFHFPVAWGWLCLSIVFACTFINTFTQHSMQRLPTKCLALKRPMRVRYHRMIHLCVRVCFFGIVPFSTVFHIFCSFIVF